MKERRRDHHALRPHRGCRVYVGGLPSDISRSDVREIFSKYRDRFDVILKNRFAFVEFDHYRDADHAIENLDGLIFRGLRDGMRFYLFSGSFICRIRDCKTERKLAFSPDFFQFITIVVEVARGPRTADKHLFKGGLDREPVRASWVQKYGEPEITKYKIIVRNLSTRIEWQDLKDLMKKAGTVTYAVAHRSSLHEGMVCFRNKHDMLKAIQIFDNYELCGRKLIIEEYYRT